MDVLVLHVRGQSLREKLNMSFAGDSILDRARSTTFALLGTIVAVGLAIVALAVHQDWPLLGDSPIPRPPRRVGPCTSRGRLRSMPRNRVPALRRRRLCPASPTPRSGAGTGRQPRAPGDDCARRRGLRTGGVARPVPRSGPADGAGRSTGSCPCVKPEPGFRCDRAGEFERREPVPNPACGQDGGEEHGQGKRSPYGVRAHRRRRRPPALARRPTMAVAMDAPSVTATRPETPTGSATRRATPRTARQGIAIHPATPTDTKTRTAAPASSDPARAPSRLGRWPRSSAPCT